MSTNDLAAYETGLDTVLGLLGHLQALAEDQRAAGEARDFGRFTAAANERDRVTAALVALEAELAPMRARLGAGREDGARLTHHTALVERHRTARTIIDSTLQIDAATVEALRDAEATRRVAASALETSEQTLAAYRRVISPNRTSSLIDART